MMGAFRGSISPGRRSSPGRDRPQTGRPATRQQEKGEGYLTQDGYRRPQSARNTSRRPQEYEKGKSYVGGWNSSAKRVRNPDNERLQSGSAPFKPSYGTGSEKRRGERWNEEFDECLDAMEEHIDMKSQYKERYGGVRGDADYYQDEKEHYDEEADYDNDEELYRGRGQHVQGVSRRTKVRKEEGYGNERVSYELTPADIYGGQTRNARPRTPQGIYRQPMTPLQKEAALRSGYGSGARMDPRGPGGPGPRYSTPGAYRSGAIPF